MDSHISKSFGELVTVVCRVTGKPQPTVVWQKDGSILSTNIQLQIIDNTTIESVLSIASVSPSDEGIYRCVGTNNLPNGTVVQSKTFTLNYTGGELQLDLILFCLLL